MSAQASPTDLTIDSQNVRSISVGSNWIEVMHGTLEAHSGIHLAGHLVVDPWLSFLTNPGAERVTLPLSALRAVRTVED